MENQMMDMDSHRPLQTAQPAAKYSFFKAFLGGCGLLLLMTACEAAQKPTLPPPRPSASSVTIETRPAGARVTIDGIIVGTSPVQAQLNPGPHLVKAALTGYFPVEQKIQVPSRTTKTFQLTLVASH